MQLLGGKLYIFHRHTYSTCSLEGGCFVQSSVDSLICGGQVQAAGFLANLFQSLSSSQSSQQRRLCVPETQNILCNTFVVQSSEHRLSSLSANNDFLNIQLVLMMLWWILLVYCKLFSEEVLLLLLFICSSKVQPDLIQILSVHCRSSWRSSLCQLFKCNFFLGAGSSGDDVMNPLSTI